MVITLDTGAELQILKLDVGFQLVEIVQQNNFSGIVKKPKVKNIGGVHKTFSGVIDEITRFSLEEYEVLSLSEIKDVVKTTSEKIKEYFDLNNEYLVNLEQPSV